MTTFHVVGKTEQEVRIVWESFPSWAHFIPIFLRHYERAGSRF